MQSKVHKAIGLHIQIFINYGQLFTMISLCVIHYENDSGFCVRIKHGLWYNIAMINGQRICADISHLYCFENDSCLGCYSGALHLIPSKQLRQITSLLLGNAGEAEKYIEVRSGYQVKIVK